VFSSGVIANTNLRLNPDIQELTGT
jgi:hypothetical protein